MSIVSQFFKVPGPSQLSQFAGVMGLPQEALVAAINDALDGNYERLKEFGIRVNTANSEYIILTARGVVSTIPATKGDLMLYLASVAALFVKQSEPAPSRTARMLELVGRERERQDEKFPGQLENNELIEYIPILGEEFGETCNALIEGTWGRTYKTHEEYNDGLRHLAEEAKQTAAVAVAIMEKVEYLIDRRDAQEYQQDPH